MLRNNRLIFVFGGLSLLLGWLFFQTAGARAPQDLHPSLDSSPSASSSQVAGALPKQPAAKIVSDSLPPKVPTEVTTAANWQDRLHPRYLQGRFEAKEHPDFVAVPAALTDGDGTYYLHREAFVAFEKMHQAAAREGIHLFIVSAFRNFERQKKIWEAKWNGHRPLEGKELAPKAYPEPSDRALAILRYSSMPGTSRHHWGSDLDLNQLNNTYFEAGEGKKIYAWLLRHAANYGFCQPYTPLGTERPHGYQEERWHWSYMPIAQPLTQFAAEHLTYEQLTGFQGAEVAQNLQVIERYVLGVNTACQ